MSKQSQHRQVRKLRRNIGSRPKTRLMVVEFLKEIAVFYYRNGHVTAGEYSANPELRFAMRQLVELDLIELGFTQLTGGNHYFRRGLTLKDLQRLFPKTQIKVLPNQQ